MCIRDRVGVVDEVLQSLALGLVLQGVTVVADGGDLHAGIPQQTLYLLRVGGQALLGEHHVEVEPYALKPRLDEMGEQLLRPLAGHAGADVDLCHTNSS